LEGPPTLSPATLTNVSAFFDYYNKTKGTNATLFNILDGITTLGSAILPFAGPAYKDAEAVFTAGFVPAVKKWRGDLSSQQLQNLTSSSWETTETVAAGGGSVVKHIFIERNSGSVSGPDSNTKSKPATACKKATDTSNPPQATPPSGTTAPDKPACKSLIYGIRKISNIIGIQVVGFEVTESDAKKANATETPSNDATQKPQDKASAPAKNKPKVPSSK
jgi:hypothetical protein